MVLTIVTDRRLRPAQPGHLLARIIDCPYYILVDTNSSAVASHHLLSPICCAFLRLPLCSSSSSFSSSSFLPQSLLSLYSSYHTIALAPTPKSLLSLPTSPNSLSLVRSSPLKTQPSINGYLIAPDLSCSRTFPGPLSLHAPCLTFTLYLPSVSAFILIYTSLLGSSSGGGKEHCLFLSRHVGQLAHISLSGLVVLHLLETRALG
jgi:hypothetical protein